MKKRSGLWCVVCAGIVFFSGIQPVFAAESSSKADLLFPIIELLHELMIKLWWVGGAILCVGVVYLAVVIVWKMKKGPK